MKFKEWINKVSDKICLQYKPVVDKSHSKQDFMNLALDVNGGYFVCDMTQKGFALPYTTILKDFKNYINGNYIADYTGSKAVYTSTMYCCYYDSDNIRISTTNTLLLGCKSKIVIQPNDYVHIYADKNCELEIYCPDTSNAHIEYWEGAKINLAENSDRISLTKHE